MYLRKAVQQNTENNEELLREIRDIRARDIRYLRDIRITQADFCSTFIHIYAF